MKNRRFLANYILEVDKRLYHEYDKPIKRDEYFTFLHWFDEKLSNNHEHNEFTLNNNVERQFWPRKMINGKRIYLLDAIISVLLKHEILVRSTFRFTGEPFCRSYSYAVNFMDAIDVDDIFVEAPINKKLANRDNIIKPTLTDNIQHILLTSSRFRIDYGEALKYVINKVHNNEISKSKAIYLINTINKLEYKRDEYITVNYSEKTHRIYSTFTQLNKELRSFCMLDGAYMHSIDLKTSQAFFMIHKLIKEYGEEPELLLLKDIIINKDLYSYIQTELKLKTRDEAKTEFFHFLFKGNKGYAKVQSLFKYKWPVFYQYFLEINRKLEKQNINLAIELQRAEADIFVTVCNRWASAGCLSVHDSLYFRQGLGPKIHPDLQGELNKAGYSNAHLVVTKARQQI